MTDAANVSPQQAGASLLDVADIGISFGGLRAVHDFSLSLPSSALFGLIGPNGAGKTTIFNLLTGVYRPDRGNMRLQGTSLVGLKPHEITSTGIARTFQNIRLFGDLSVLDNVRLAGQLHHSAGLLSTLARGSKFRRSEAELQTLALELLAVFELDGLARAPACSLSYGHQRRLEITRALATEPLVLLLDEPAAGMNPQEKAALSRVIETLPERFGVSILLIDHDMGLVMGVCEQITVLDHGQVIAHGTPEDIQSDPRVIAAYLGEPTPDDSGDEK